VVFLARLDLVGLGLLLGDELLVRFFGDKLFLLGDGLMMLGLFLVV